MISSGVTTFPLDLDILAPSLLTIPWASSRVKGSTAFRQAGIVEDLGKEAGVHEVQDGMLNAADILVHGHPVIHIGCRKRPPVKPGLQ
jgi:hypothetical protein